MSHWASEQIFLGEKKKEWKVQQPILGAAVTYGWGQGLVIKR